MNRFHTVERITDYGVKQVLFKRGNKILAWAEELFTFRQSLKWEFFIGKPSIRPQITYTARSYEEAETRIMTLLKRRKEV